MTLRRARPTSLPWYLDNKVCRQSCRDGVRASTASDPVEVRVEVHVADEAGGIDHRVGDGQGQHSPGALEPPAEDQPHDQVAEEAAPALIQVVCATQQRTGPERPLVRPAQLT